MRSGIGIQAYSRSGQASSCSLTDTHTREKFCIEKVRGRKRKVVEADE